MHRAVSVAVVAAALAGSAAAKTLPTGGATVGDIAEVLQAKGYKAEIGTDRVGDPMILSAESGTTFQVLFYGCKGETNASKRCVAIQLSAAWDLPSGMTLARINEWNRKRRFGRAYLDDEMDPHVQMDVDLERGSTTESVDNNLDTWFQVLKEFRAMVHE
jgi:hypothetical protein